MDTACNEPVLLLDFGHRFHFCLVGDFGRGLGPRGLLFLLDRRLGGSRLGVGAFLHLHAFRGGLRHTLEVEGPRDDKRDRKDREDDGLDVEVLTLHVRAVSAPLSPELILLLSARELYRSRREIAFCLLVSSA